MAASPATTESRYVRSPSGSAASRGARPLPFPPSRVPVPVEPLPVPTPAPAPPPLNVAPSHTNFLLDRFVGGFRRLYRPNVKRRGSSVPQEPTDVENNAANAPGFSQSPPGTYEEPVTVHVAQDGHTFVPDTASTHLSAVPGPPGGFYSPSVLSPQSALAPSIHHTSRAPSVRIEYAEPMPPGSQSGFHSRTSSMARNDVSARHSRAPSDNGDDDDDGEGDHATAVGHGDGVSIVRSQTAPTSTPYIAPHFINGLADGAPSKEPPPPPPGPKTSPYGSTFAAIANAIQHVRSLPWVTQIVTEEWKPPNTRVGPPSASQSWYTEGPRSAAMYPGSAGGFFPPNYYPQPPPSQPLTTTMSLSPGTISPPYSFSPDGRPWPPGTQYYYNPQYNTQPLISPAPPPPPAHPHMSSPMDQTPSLLLRNSTLQPPPIPPSTYLSAGGSTHRSRAASSAYGHAQ